MTDNDVLDRVAAQAACDAALDDLTASLTEVLKAVTRVHRAVKRLTDAYGDTAVAEAVVQEAR